MRRRWRRKLNAPVQPIWVLAVIIGVLGIVSRYVLITGVTPYSFSLLAIGFIMLVVATMTRGV